MWSVECYPDPVSDVAYSLSKGKQASVRSSVVLGRVPIRTVLRNADDQQAFQEGQRVARVALSDFVAHRISKNGTTVTTDECQVSVEPLDKFLACRTRRGKQKQANGNSSYAPFMLERSDVWCNETDLNVIVRVTVVQNDDCKQGQQQFMHAMDEKKTSDTTTTSALDQLVLNAATEFLSTCILNADCSSQIMQHVACAVVQNRLREELKREGRVAFVADGAILPRKSGASTLPMASPPAIPFEAPKDSPTRQVLTINMGLLTKYIPAGSSSFTTNDDGTSVSFTGLVVPAGITLICGGGYHGKVRNSTCLFVLLFKKDHSLLTP